MHSPVSHLFVWLFVSLWLIGPPTTASESMQPGAMAFYEGDLPPPGTRSLFDRLVLSKGPVPFPFTELTALLRGYAEHDAPLVSLFVPDGRSLVRAKGDYRHPRVVVAMGAQPKPGSGAPALRSRLFIGYVEDAAQLEVVSYNDRAGRFEYQLVDNYRAGAVPEVRYAPRSLCQTCHQDGSALFSVRPWAETNANAAVARRIAEVRGSGIDGEYQGLPIKQPLREAERFDALTDNASHLLTSQRAWMEGCGAGEAGRECRRLMLILVLRFAWSPARFDPRGPDAEALRAAQRGVWPEYGVPLPDVDIRSRDPFAPPRTKSLTEQLAGWFEPNPDESIAAITPLPAELNPITRRADRKSLDANSLEAVFGLAQVFTPADIDRLRQAAGQDLSRLTAAVGVTQLARQLGGGPLVREPVVNALLAALGAPVPAPGCCEDEDVPGTPEVTGVVPLTLAPESALLPFERYCFGCHRGSPLPELDFLGAGSEAEVWRQLSVNKRHIADTLDWQSTKLPMPPPGSRQWRQLQSVIDGGGDPLDELRRALRRGGPQTAREVSWPLLLMGGLLVAGVALYLLLALFNLIRRRRWQRNSLALQQQCWQQQLANLAQQRLRIERNRVAGQSLWSGNRRFEVRERVEESEGVVSLRLTPFDGRPLNGFIPGQYLTLELRPAGSERPLVRCYSLSDGVHRDSCRITVKRELPPANHPDVAPGLASNWIHDHLHTGSLVEVRAPAGRFVVDDDNDDQRALVFIVGGIGITPVLSILEGLAEQQSQREIHLFFAVRDGSRHLFAGRLRQLEGELPGLTLQVSYSRPRAVDQLGRDYHQAGRINFERVRDALPSGNFRFYLCGPAAVTESMVGALLQWGVPRQDIRYEAYHAMNVDLSRSDRRELAGVRARVRFARSGREVDWDPRADSLLELAEAHGIDIDSGCRAGNCGSCRVGIRSGEVRYVGHHDLDPEQGACLTCVTVPRGDLVLDA